ncbi:S-adenosyl-L-methionine-dependent methyltransferase [Immersiella caudata]|uniref:S-adenosyl-L-methionine-dependent methyltransferase n=1 Tax=Immersiella caudata TaxID=314043 RepID=A0AA40BWP4_9PEZI|nr:S-adenosyl-L-methionine-dependent methyltransferase [Immersiella caudata]
MSSTSSGAANPASVSSSASTVITVGVHPADEEELYAAVGIARRSRPGVSRQSVASPGLSSAVASPPRGGTRRNSDDTNSTGDDLDFEPELVKQSASMSSSVRAHVYEGGIRYHAFRDGKYALPNDEAEQNRDDMKHMMTLMLCNGAHFLAPVEAALKSGAEVLDLGTGTGIWAMELGDKYPDTKIIGIDLSPIQPDFVPENVHFFVDDFEEEWVDPEHKYDYIHIRYTLFSVRDRKALYRRALHHLKPGGYIEFQELEYRPRCDDESLTDETPYALRDYIKFIKDGMRNFGADIHAIRTLPEELTAAGFEDVRLTTHKCPLGLWPRDKRLRLCGLFLRTAFMDGLRGVSQRPLKALGWTQLQIEMFLVDVRKAIMDPHIHAYFTFNVVCGRKPVQ